MFTGPKTAKTQTATSSGRFTKFATSDPLFQCCRYQNRTRSRCVVPAALMYSIVTLNLWSYTKQICTNKLATDSPDQFVISSYFVFSKQILCLSCTSLLPTQFPRKTQSFQATVGVLSIVKPTPVCIQYDWLAFFGTSRRITSPKRHLGMILFFMHASTKKDAQNILHLDRFFLAKATMGS